jgi:hypothetical protein
MMSFSLFKYTNQQYASKLLSNGELLFRSLSFFLACEQEQRGDKLEGIREYEPVAGLEITRQTGERFTLSGAFRSSVKYPDRIFVFSTSMLLSADLAVAFQCDACVEIMDISKFVARLKTALRREPRVKLRTLIHDNVTYYDPRDPPEEVWALPDRIAMHKSVAFENQKEYRFAFSTKADAWGFENVNVAIYRGEETKFQNVEYPKMLLKLGPMKDYARIHTF